MSTDEVPRLADLLERAVANVVVTHDRTNQQLDVSTYRDKLQRHWSHHWPELDLNHPNQYTPAIVRPEIHEELLATARSALGENVREDRVQSAAIVAVGGYGPGFSLGDLVERLVIVAIGRGHEHVAAEFYRAVDGGAAVYRWIGLLLGVRVEHAIEVAPHIRIVPMPNSTGDLPAYFPHMSYMNPIDLLGCTLIVVEHSARPVFGDPDPLRFPEDIFRREQLCTELPNFNIDQFCDALSLASNGSVEAVSEWTHVDPDALFIPKLSHTGMGHRHYPFALRKRGSVKATEDEVQNAVALYEARSSLSRLDAQKLEVPIKRWIKSKTDQSLEDTFIDLGIALESLYLDRGNRSELSFRLRLRAAWFLGLDFTERESVMTNIGKIYGLRSNAVHNGSVAYKRENRDVRDKAQEICLRSITKMIRHVATHGKFPDWERLVLGDANER